MFKTDTEAISFIEKRIIKSSFEEYQKKLIKHNIPTSNIKFIHVTGTNGKGSTVNFLSHFLMQKGYKIGTFTSPYMVSYHDRICINDKPISGKDLLDIVNRYYDMIIEENLSKFEIDVLIMLVYFHEQNIDYGIIEVGIGGLNDKTNVISSCLSLITNIGYDHMPSLGSTLEEVSYQKAGIIKPNSCVITTEKRQNCLDVISSYAKSKNAKMISVNPPKLIDYPLKFNYLDYEIDLKDRPLYQVNNICLALTALNELGVLLNDKEIEEAINQSFWPGRYEKINERVIVDGAHNIDGINALIETLELEKEPIVIIFSALKDKDYPLMIEKLSKKYLVYLTIFEDERKIDINELRDYPHVFNNFNDAYDAALKLDRKIIVTGSLHFISEVRKILKSM